METVLMNTMMLWTETLHVHQGHFITIRNKVHFVNNMETAGKWSDWCNSTTQTLSKHCKLPTLNMHVQSLHKNATSVRCNNWHNVLPRSETEPRKTCKDNLIVFIFYNLIVGEQGWRSGESACLPPTNVAPVWIQDPASYVVWVCCWFSSLLRGFFSWFSSFPPSSKNQHF